MTVATNALLEGARRADRVRRHRGVHRPRRARAPEPRRALPAVRGAGRRRSYRAERRFGAAERMTPDGPLRGADDDDAARWLAAAARVREPEAVAVALLHSYRHPEHERAIGDAIAAALPDVHVSLSHEVVGTFREYERAATTEVDAALSPLLAGYLRRLRRRAATRRAPEPAIMQSNGGLIDAARRRRARRLDGALGAGRRRRRRGLRGPRGGRARRAVLRHGRHLVRRLRRRRRRGPGAKRRRRSPAGRWRCRCSPSTRSAPAAARSPGATPAARCASGPRSAGADPGPACYGRGGTEPTVTDANLVLGYLLADAPLAGGVELDLRRRASARSARLAARARARAARSAPRGSSGSPTPRWSERCGS